MLLPMSDRHHDALVAAVVTLQRLQKKDITMAGVQYWVIDPSSFNMATLRRNCSHYGQSRRGFKQPAVDEE